MATGTQASALSPSGGRRGRLPREARRAQLLERARELFGEKGYHATSVADIIRRAELARGTFYLYFENKPQLFEAMLEDLLARLDRSLSLPEPGRGRPLLAEQLQTALRQVLATLMADPVVVRLVLGEAEGLDGESRSRVRAFLRVVLARIAGVLRAGQAMGLIHPCHTGLTAAFLFGGLQEVMRQLITHPERYPALEGVAEELLQGGLGGVLVTETGAVKMGA